MLYDSIFNKHISIFNKHINHVRINVQPIYYNILLSITLPAIK